MAEETINPKVDQTIADMDGVRIAERSTQDYPRHFWSAYKNGHYRFALAGVAIVAPLAALMGVAVAGAFGLMSVAVPIAIAFGAAGALMGAEGFGAVGAASASRAAGLAEKHARILDAEAQGKGIIEATDDKLMYNGRGQHFEFPPGRDKGKFYSWKSGLTGGVLGALSGAALGFGGAELAGGIHGVAAIGAAAAHVPVLASLATSIAGGLTTLGVTAAAAPVVAGLVIAGALTFGLFGLTFGLERKVLKSSFNQTDANVNGDITFKNGPDLGRAQSLESDSDLAKHRLRRQEEINRLEKEYNNRISWGALTGRFKGFGGAIPGAAIGAAVGAALVGVLSLASVAAVPVAATIGLLAMAGAMLGMDVFSQSGTEAGAEATARAIDNEFERNRALRARGITPPTPKEPKGSWLSLKPALLCGVLGAVAGAAITPIFGPGILAVLGSATGHAIAATTATGALTGSSYLASSLIGGLTGVTYGVGSKSLRAMSAPGNWLYDRVYNGYSHNYSTQMRAAERDNTTLLEVPPPASSVNQVTPEEAALLNERLSAGGGKNFTQMTQQAQPAHIITVGV